MAELNTLHNQRRCLVVSLSFMLLGVLLIYDTTKRNYATYREPLPANDDSFNSINVIHENLVISLTPPETLLHNLCDQLNKIDRSKITSLKYSKMAFVTINNEDGAVIVLIHTRDIRDRPNTRGDDVIVIWAEEKYSDGRVSGEVIDHKNGSYTGILRLFWSGVTIIRATLASSIINTCLKMKAIKKYGNAVFAIEPHGWGIRGTFENKLTKEISPCGSNPTIFGYINICNFTAINGDMPWFCGKPKSKHLSCSDIHLFGSGKFKTNRVSQADTIQNPGHGLFQSTVTINVPAGLPSSVNISDIPCKDSPSYTSWENKAPTGYWLDNAWHMTYCRSEIKKTFVDYKSCLRGKTIIIIGDSTLRQYADFILTYIMGTKNKFMQAQVGPDEPYHDVKNMFIRHGITLRYLRHEMPFHNDKGFSIMGIQSVPQLLDSFALENMTDLIVVVNYNSHMSAYPPSVLRHCYRELSKAFRRLSIANPSARLFVKPPHLVIDNIRWFDPHIELLDTAMLREEFSDMHDKVVLLDIWAISVAHNCHLLHPRDKALYSQMHQLLSHLC